MKLKNRLLDYLFIILLVFMIFPLAGWFWGMTIQHNDGTVSMMTSKLTMNCGDTLSRDAEGIKYTSGWTHDDTGNTMDLNDIGETIKGGTKLRLTHTADTAYAELTADTNGDLTLGVTGDEIKLSDVLAITNSIAARDVIWGKGAAGQSGNYLDLQDNSGNTVFGVHSNGLLEILQSVTGEMKVVVYTEDDFDDLDTINLPDAVTGFGIAVLKYSGTSSTHGGIFAVNSAGVTGIAVGSSTFVTTNSDTYFCVYDGGTRGIIKNQIANNCHLHVIFFFH